MTETHIQVVFALLDARRRRDIDAATALLHPDVVHPRRHGRARLQQPRPRCFTVCASSFPQRDDGVEHLELVDAGERVVLGLRQ
jgi:ketosteroid isomerase-like protein